MKVFLSLLVTMLFTAGVSNAQNAKPKRVSPPDSVMRRIKSGATVTIRYSKPSLNGRTVGVDVEPKDGTEWRMGANEATVFEVDRDVRINGQMLPAGKYALFGLKQNDRFTLIFNRDWAIWGTKYDEHKGNDALHVETACSNSNPVAEKLTYRIDKKGKVEVLWGTLKVDFRVK